MLAARRLVLVLDNCEHVVDAVARLAGRVLAAAPGVRILATSREPLGVTGETLCPVPSLPLPPDGATPDAGPGLCRGPAVRGPGGGGPARVHARRRDGAGPVVRICRALDGIPLAIELAAARLRSLTPAQVAGRLDDRFRLLAAGSRAALPRHQTLRAIVDWSWDLLNEARAHGAAAAVGVQRRRHPRRGRAGLRARHPAGIIDVIASLVDKSLVIATGDAEVRYRLLETVRAYAAERLAEAGEEEQVRAAHARYFVALAERAEPTAAAPEQLRWLDRLAAEHDNCSAALRYAIEHRRVDLALRLVELPDLVLGHARLRKLKAATGPRRCWR